MQSKSNKASWNNSAMIGVILDALEGNLKEDSQQVINIRNELFPAITGQFITQRLTPPEFVTLTLENSIFALFNYADPSKVVSRKLLDKEKLDAIQSCNIQHLLENICLPALKSLGNDELLKPISVPHQSPNKFAQAFLNRVNPAPAKKIEESKSHKNDDPMISRKSVQRHVEPAKILDREEVDQSIERTKEIVSKNLAALQSMENSLIKTAKEKARIKTEESIVKGIIEAAQKGYAEELARFGLFSDDEKQGTLLAIKLQNQFLEECVNSAPAISKVK